MHQNKLTIEQVRDLYREGKIPRELMEAVETAERQRQRQAPCAADMEVIAEALRDRTIHATGDDMRSILHQNGASEAVRIKALETVLANTIRGLRVAQEQHDEQLQNVYDLQREMNDKLDAAEQAAAERAVESMRRQLHEADEHCVALSAECCERGEKLAKAEAQNATLYAEWKASAQDAAKWKRLYMLRLVALGNVLPGYDPADEVAEARDWLARTAEAKRQQSQSHASQSQGAAVEALANAIATIPTLKR